MLRQLLQLHSRCVCPPSQNNEPAKGKVCLLVFCVCPQHLVWLQSHRRCSSIKVYSPAFYFLFLLTGKCQTIAQSFLVFCNKHCILARYRPHLGTFSENKIESVCDKCPFNNAIISPNVLKEERNHERENITSSESLSSVQDLSAYEPPKVVTLQDIFNTSPLVPHICPFSLAVMLKLNNYTFDYDHHLLIGLVYFTTYPPRPPLPVHSHSSNSPSNALPSTFLLIKNILCILLIK